MKQLSNMSDDELKATIANADAAVENVRKNARAAEKVLKSREKYNAWVSKLENFTHDLLQGAAKASAKPGSKVEVGIDSDISPGYVMNTQGFQKVVDAISRKFNAIITIKYDDGGSDAGGWCCPMPSSSAIITICTKALPLSPEEAIIQKLLDEIERT